MWFLRTFAAGLLFAAVLLFAILNVQSAVDIRFLPGARATYHVQLVFGLFVAFVLGALTWFVISLVHEIGVRRELARLRRESDRLRAELTALRNLPLEDALVDPAPIGGTPAGAASAERVAR